MKKHFLFQAILLFLILFTFSCTPSKKANYFDNLPDSLVVKLPMAEKEERIIQIGDELSIYFSAKDAEALSAFNRRTSLVAAARTSPNNGPDEVPALGFVVDPEGLIEMPVLGKLKVTGNTARQLKTRLTQAIMPYVVEPIVEVRFISFNVTVLGEVRGPGRYNLGLGKTTIFEALAAAGDLPYTAKKYNIQLLRDYNGERVVKKIDITNKSILYNQQPFQMKPNDVLYVQSRKIAGLQQNVGLIASIVTVLLSVVTVAFAFKN